MYFFKGSGKEQFPLSSLLPIKSDQNVVETLKSATKWNAKNRPGMSADVFFGGGITIATIVVGCTIVIGLFEWCDRSWMENWNSETLLWRKSIYDLNMRVAKLSPLGETMEKH